ncbi:hypothetical protein A3Q56_06634, partial [Intoshia linei]
MEHIDQPKQLFDERGCMTKSASEWIEYYDIYISLLNKKLYDCQQINLIKYLMGQRARLRLKRGHVHDSIVLIKKAIQSWDKRNATLERIKFDKIQRNFNEQIDVFIDRLDLQAGRCEFKNKYERIRDAIVLNCKH